ncbi:hypothetical protein FRC12_012862 [Ceratobasidium sp. 428]|nr:hypothetical protein FRC12_012862 [Ceratobasidium sp. 428]
MTTLLPSSHSKDYQARISDAGGIGAPAPSPSTSLAKKPPTSSNDMDLLDRSHRRNVDTGGQEQAPISNDKSKPDVAQPSPDEDEESGFVEAPRPDYDDYGQELGKNARFWKTYVREAYRWDADIVDGWNKSLDLILIFAALFSAISTAFVIESSKSLQPDPADTSAQTLSIISQTLLAIVNAQQGVPFDFTPPTATAFVPPISTICVNALWYLSLSLSVSVSLVALLAKDWARAYMAELTGQPYQQARKRQQRWDSLEKWRMPQVIMFLPIILHLALLLFAVGLTVYLWHIHLGVGIPLFIVTLVSTGVYAVSTALPLVHENCPYSTPLTQLLTTLAKYSRKLASPVKPYTNKLFHSSGSQLFDPEALNLGASEGQASTASEKKESQTDETDLMDSLTSRAIAWLLTNYEDTKSADVALQAIAGAHSHLPLQPLIDCNAKTLLLQRLDTCYATRQKTGKRYLKNLNLLESATLFSRASAVVQMGTTSFYGYSDDLARNYRYWYSLEDTPLCLVDQCLKQSSWSLNKAAFALASWAFIEIDYLPTTTWVARTVDVFESHCNDRGALDSEALLILLKSVSYVLAVQEFDSTSLLLAIVRLLVSLRSSPESPATKYVGVALISQNVLRPDTSSKLSLSNTDQDAGLETPRSRYRQLVDAVMGRPELVPLYVPQLGLLELLKYHSQTREHLDLLSINEALQKHPDRPDSLKIHGFVIERSGYNSRYFAELIIPRVKPANDGSFADSELVRATHLSVVRMDFLDALTDLERLNALKLGLVNLESATTNCLTQSCCNLIKGFSYCSFFEDEDGHWRRGESVTPLLPLFPLLPLLPLLHLTESTDERILPYAMRALWKITDLIGFSNMSAEEKQRILDPMLSHEPFASARSKTDNDVCSSTELAKDMGYAEVWLNRLENVQGKVLQHIHDAHVLENISPGAYNILYHSNLEIDSHSVGGRALALVKRCDSENKAAGNRPLWPLDNDLAAP